MDRDEVNSPFGSQYANTSQVEGSDQVLLPGITGREDDLGADSASPSAADVDKPIGARPRSEVTGRHQPGMGANETTDGLSETEEAVRVAAEDETDVEESDREGSDDPVFDRADTIVKII
ncbi:hypothetical protein IVB15_10810 [Bradyrhizobium sp. 182]|uniref:hypothetical protein n=1 Tax=unclassified Bradyrhizobium TaxID=2631580 RepID=UPI001FFBD7C8|nr:MULTISPECIES: hypothetical protein [unclassified Bradyrhizobium]MCK1421336.1 hypothetical protein [Bradyrhizobium sp. CW12]MCK1528214.1 hypothetical protein [Bradyrhizobium sp. 182]MCK1643440.1 hypothetical protein [Bradyrhizobium sp. 154]